MKPPVLMSTKSMKKTPWRHSDPLRCRVNYVDPDGNESIGFLSYLGMEVCIFIFFI
jgi:hypothetical protein